MDILGVVSGLFKPVVGIFQKREERKQNRETAQAALAQGKQDNSHTLDLNKDQWEQLQVQGMADTWKDEYITVTIGSILNLIVIGGLLAAFGYPQVLEGVSIAIRALGEVGVDVGFLMKATVLAGLGLSVWKRF